MTDAMRVYRLSIDSPLANESAPNFRLPTWPPPREFPVVIDRNGRVVSRYGDAIWDLSVWDKVPKLVNFGDGPQPERYSQISTINADTFRMVVAWWLWGPRGVFMAGTLVSQHRAIKCLFVICSDHGIDARTLSRYPNLIAEIATKVSPSARSNALTLLHSLFEQRAQLGFTLLDREGLKKLAAAFPATPDVAQTAYIPPRIWSYQVNRLHAVLHDFQQSKGKIDAFYHAVLNAYENNYGSLRASHGNPERRDLDGKSGRSTSTFERWAKEYDVYELLCRWCQRPEGRKSLPLSSLTNYLALVNRAGLAYLLNFSLMRMQEAWDLRVDCLHIERDNKLGEIAMLCGETTKTIVDDDARWITSPSAVIAVEAMAAISAWRVNVRKAYGDTLPDGVPHLYQPTCEPWKRTSRARSLRGMYPSYAAIFKDYPKLFDPSEIRVTKEDWNLAKLVTPTLDEETFGVGKFWRFAWHQLRRTGSVNMQASGLVSDFSLQFQLKHATVATSLYYGQGHSYLAFNRAAKSEYIRAMYEMMGKELSMLLADRFVSPYGDERKRAMLKIVSEGDNNKLLSAAKAGRVAWRATLLGGCTKRGPCEYGGVDNIVRCGGGGDLSPCADALFDRSRIPAIEHLRITMSNQLERTEPASPLKSSLQAQLRATENALNVLKNN